MKKKYLFWLLPLFLFLLQIPMTLGGNHQIRNEEAVWSLREVWWFKNRLLYQPPNSNVGWYAMLNGVYALFGFSIFAAKTYRLVLSFFSLFALSALLKKYLGEKLSILPMLTVGLSPVLLSFNTQATAYGIDLQFLPIVLYCIDAGEYASFFGFALAMIAWLSYPTFGFYLPALFLLSLRGVLSIDDEAISNKAVRLPRPRKGLVLAMTIIGFFLPLLGVVIYFGGWPGKLFFAGGSLQVNEDFFFRSLGATVTNLFDQATAYYLEVNQVEFSLLFPIITFLFVLITSFIIFRKYKAARLLIALCVLTAVLDIGITGFTIDGGIPGGRRSTPFIASIYGLFVIVWYISMSSRAQTITSVRGDLPNRDKKIAAVASLPRNDKKRRLVICILSLILVHHVIVYPLNLQSIKNPSPFKLNIWFGNGNPEAGFNTYLVALQKHDVYFNCSKTYPGDAQCQYGLLYAGLAEACYWNHLSCHTMYGYFPDVGYQILSIQSINYWQENGFEH